MKHTTNPLRFALAGALVACAALAGALGAQQRAPFELRIHGSHGPLNTPSAIPVTGATKLFRNVAPMNTSQSGRPASTS